MSGLRGVVIRILRGLWRRREDLHRVGVALAAVGFVLWMIDGRQWRYAFLLYIGAAPGMSIAAAAAVARFRRWRRGRRNED